MHSQDPAVFLAAAGALVCAAMIAQTLGLG